MLYVLKYVTCLAISANETSNLDKTKTKKEILKKGMELGKWGIYLLTSAIAQKVRIINSCQSYFKIKKK